MAENGFLHGYCVQWHKLKGFGFIRRDPVIGDPSPPKQDYFVHWTEIRVDGRKYLVEDEQVSFLPEKTDKGWQATKVVTARTEVK